MKNQSRANLSNQQREYFEIAEHKGMWSFMRGRCDELINGVEQIQHGAKYAFLDRTRLEEIGDSVREVKLEFARWLRIA